MKIAVLAVVLCSALAWGQSADQNGNQSSAAEKKRVSLSESLPQSAEHKGAWDIGIWGGGGRRIGGGFRTEHVPAFPPLPSLIIRSDNVGDVSVGNLGFRLGKILTGEHGSGWYRGNFEYAVDLIPMYLLSGVQRRTIITPFPCPFLIGIPNPCVDKLFTPSRTVYGGGFNPLVAKWNFTAPRRISPYFELNGGVLFTNTEVPIGTSNVNFMSGGAIGMNIFTSLHHALSLDFRYTHISNAGLATPNPGINTLQGQIGFHWFK